ncbi:MAG: signal peptidase I [Lactobacillales bacterium]|jgi:signal peptidase I|nr:signal peptidase I [Lactobacillales bacterium]
MKKIKLKPTNKWLDRFWLTIKLFIVSFFIVFIIRGFFLIPVPVIGSSMEKNLSPGDMMIMEKFTKIHRFDVVVIKLPTDEIIVKRVIGLPGESISYENNELYVDDKKVSEPFLKENEKEYQSKSFYTNDFDLEMISGRKTLAKETYFVLGDNRPMSRDSRSFGVVSQNEILGKARLVYYPFKDMKVLSKN